MSWIRQYIVVFASGTASMFLGASLVHNIFEPDMTLPKINNNNKKNIQQDNNEIKVKKNVIK